ncbi:MAG: hypothetical protein VW362_09750 [Candidatus Nanopelagicales bacterium]
MKRRQPTKTDPRRTRALNRALAYHLIPVLDIGAVVAQLEQVYAETQPDTAAFFTQADRALARYPRTTAISEPGS